MLPTATSNEISVSISSSSPLVPEKRMASIILPSFKKASEITFSEIQDQKAQDAFRAERLVKKIKQEKGAKVVELQHQQTGCPICLSEEYTDPIILEACGHAFCRKCLVDVANAKFISTNKKKPNCPFCRTIITEEVSELCTRSPSVALNSTCGSEMNFRCPYCMIQLDPTTYHNQTIRCKCELVSCDYCRDRVPKRVWRAHNQSCHDEITSVARGEFNRKRDVETFRKKIQNGQEEMLRLSVELEKYDMKLIELEDQGERIHKDLDKFTLKALIKVESDLGFKMTDYCWQRSDFARLSNDRVEQQQQEQQKAPMKTGTPKKPSIATKISMFPKYGRLSDSHQLAVQHLQTQTRQQQNMEDVGIQKYISDRFENASPNIDGSGTRNKKLR